jgi:hypothetical protein
MKFTKKADAAKCPQAFLHVGLLINKHAGEANLSFDMSSGIFYTEASCEYFATLTAYADICYRLLNIRQCRRLCLAPLGAISIAGRPS